MSRKQHWCQYHTMSESPVLINPFPKGAFEMWYILILLWTECYHKGRPSESRRSTKWCAGGKMKTALQRFIDKKPCILRRPVSFVYHIEQDDGLKEVMLISSTDLLHKSHNAPVPYPTMHCFVTEICTSVHLHAIYAIFSCVCVVWCCVVWCGVCMCCACAVRVLCMCACAWVV